MESAILAKCLLLGLVILWIQIHGNKGCFETERLALLDFKEFVGSNGLDVDYLLSSWVDNSTSDCCKWERVMCNSTTGHVTELSLNNTRQYDIESISFYDDENIGFKRLEELDISENRFNRNILLSLDAITSLKTLKFSYNDMEGSFPIQELSKLKNLESLDVSGNGFNSTLPFQELSTFKSLEILNLMGNEFTGSIPEYMWTPPSLKVLYLYHNKLNGSLPNQSLCGLKGLQELDLGYNEFGGSLPQCLDNLTSLTFLYLSGNQLTGHIPSSWPANLKF
ncbi:hypothetical protein GH714_013554 [Hevea brasiliensis]|uniref:Leucine-rich repeat-containing N-terminal plant-type domain-containing protein n=1 Tax=Hevea brasiliensis TaxID=3981 RepID=A0A6A6M1C1_HEVBR|nr:hypothetical protein GH714_013554 [Hevea brasiliensis]